MQNLKVGYLESEQGTRILLSQEKPQFAPFLPNQPISPDDYACIIVSQPHSASLVKNVRDYVQNGGSLLTTIEFAVLMDKSLTAERTHINYIEPEGELFQNTGLLWLEQEGFISASAEEGKIGEKKAVLKEKLGKGSYIALPFNFNEAMLDLRSARRGFSFSKKIPSENVSAVAKGTVRALFTNCLIALHQQRNLPYINIWHYPDGAKSVFAFRIDLDEWGHEDVLKTLEIANTENIKMCWALNAGHPNYDEGLVRDLTLSSQEVNSHGFEHDVFDDYGKNLRNLEQAHKKIKESSKAPHAFIAPFGKWNPSLGKAAEQLGYLYGSEFRLAFDDLPFRPIVEGRQSSVLQIPIHPMCLHHMITQDYAQEEMLHYFKSVIDQLQAQQLPILLYGHPTDRIGKYSQVIRKAINYAIEKHGVQTTSFKEFANWWIDRELISFHASYDKGKINAEFTEIYPKASLRIIAKNGYALLPLTNDELEIFPERLRFEPLPKVQKTALSTEFSKIPLAKHIVHKGVMAVKLFMKK